MARQQTLNDRDTTQIYSMRIAVQKKRKGGRLFSTGHFFNCHSERVLEATKHREIGYFSRKCSSQGQFQRRISALIYRETLRWCFEVVRIAYLTRSG